MGMKNITGQSWGLTGLLLFSEFLVSFEGGDDTFHGSGAEAAFFHGPQACNGAAAGGTDRIFQGTGMGLGF